MSYNLTDWKEIYKDTSVNDTNLERERKNDLVVITRESARLGAIALVRINSDNFYHNNGAAERELRGAAESDE